MFSEKHSFSKTQLVKPHFFFTCQKNTFFKKRCHFWFWPISAETTISIVFPLLHCFGPKTFWPKQIVCTKVRVFFLPDTNSVSQFLKKKKNIFFEFSHFWMTTSKNTFFIELSGLFPFSLFFFFFSISISPT